MDRGKGRVKTGEKRGREGGKEIERRDNSASGTAEAYR